VTAKKFYYDTVCYGSKAAFTCALEAFGADHLMTGSDYPGERCIMPLAAPGS
jgi:aminocarboxymuconate-semialdehyde decarboxylase